jgi:hypothetical protein
MYNAGIPSLSEFGSARRVNSIKMIRSETGYINWVTFIIRMDINFPFEIDRRIQWYHQIIPGIVYPDFHSIISQIILVLRVNIAIFSMINMDSKTVS